MHDEEEEGSSEKSKYTKRFRKKQKSNKQCKQVESEKRRTKHKKIFLENEFMFWTFFAFSTRIRKSEREKRNKQQTKTISYFVLKNTRRNCVCLLKANERMQKSSTTKRISSTALSDLVELDTTAIRWV